MLLTLDTQIRACYKFAYVYLIPCTRSTSWLMTKILSFIYYYPIIMQRWFKLRPNRKTKLRFNAVISQSDVRRIQKFLALRSRVPTHHIPQPHKLFCVQGLSAQVGKPNYLQILHLVPHWQCPDVCSLGPLRQWTPIHHYLDRCLIILVHHRRSIRL